MADDQKNNSGTGVLDTPEDERETGRRSYRDRQSQSSLNSKQQGPPSYIPENNSSLGVLDKPEIERETGRKSYRDRQSQISLNSKQQGPVSYIPENISDVQPAAQRLTKAIPEIEEYAPILKHLKDNDIGQSKAASVAQKGAQLGGEIAGFVGKDKMAGKFDKARNFVTPRDAVRERNEQEDENQESPRRQLSGGQKNVKFVVKYEQLERIAELAEEFARMTNYEDVADIAEIIKDGLEEGSLSAADLNDAGKIRDRVANTLGNRASNIAQGKGMLGKRVNDRLGLGTMSRGAGKALGGAIAGAISDGTVLGAGQSALSWYVLDFALLSLITPWSPIALLYLDLHYIFAKGGSNWFRMPSRWQRVLIWTANIIYLILIPLGIGILMVAGCNYPIGNNFVTGYRLTAIGAFIGNDCAAFDINNLGSNADSGGIGKGGQSGGAGATGSFANPATATTTPNP